MIVSHPLGGSDKNYNSRRSRQSLTNAYVELNSDQSFSRIRKAAGLSRLNEDYNNSTTTHMIEVNKTVYLVTGSRNLYSISLGVVTDLGQILEGTVTGLEATSNQVMVLTTASGYLYDDINGFRKITDLNMVGGVGLASLNQIFWVAKNDSNIFQGSETGNGEVWPSTRQASAEESADDLISIIAVKSSLWLIGRETCEYWQTDINDTQVPVRKVLGATIEKGALNRESIAKYEDMVFFLANDGTAVIIKGNSLIKISDMNLEYAINGDSAVPGYESPDSNTGFFINDPVHKFYVLTFINDRATWVYDLATGLWHRRESVKAGVRQGLWRASQSVTIFEEDEISETSLVRVIVGDLEFNGQESGLYEFSYQSLDELGNDILVEIVTPALQDRASDLFIGSTEVITEVGVGNDVAVDPKLQVAFSKDGGASWVEKESLSLGTVGNRQKRTRRFLNTRLKRGFNFLLRYRFSSFAEFVIYSQDLDIEKGVS